MADRRVIAWDCETWLFKPYRMAPKVVCLSWADDQGSGLEVGADNIERWLHQQLLDGDVLLVGHVVSYDTSCVLATFPSVWGKLWKAYEHDRITCTSIREKLLDIAVGEFRKHQVGLAWKKHTYHLADLAERRLGVKLAKGEDTWRLRYAELDGVPLEQWPKEAVDYAVGDAVTTRALFMNQVERAGRLSYSLPTQFDDVRADFALRLASVWGIETDQAQVRMLWKQTIEQMQGLAPELIASGLAKGLGEPDAKGVPKIRKSMIALRAMVEQHYPGGDPPKTPKGAIKTSRDVVRECAFEPLQRLSEFSRLQKIASTYLSKLFGLVVHARFDAIGAASDRTSSSGPNLQNQPRLQGLRECFKARDGYVFLSCDYDTQEMRTLAQTCLDIVGYSRLAERYQANRHFDPHLEFAAMLAGISVEEAAKRKADGNAEIKEFRQRSKCANFGNPGGMGPDKFVQYARGYGLTLSREEAYELRENWFLQWPEMRDYFRGVENVVGPAGLGRQIIPRSGFIRGGCDYCNLANGYFQTLAAHASKAAMFAVCKRAYCNRESALYGSRPVVFVHDEVILETPEEAGDIAAKEIVQVMEETMQKWTPEVPVAASAVLMRRWSKGAEPTFSAEGKLVPWEEEEPENQ